MSEFALPGGVHEARIRYGTGWPETPAVDGFSSDDPSHSAGCSAGARAGAERPALCPQDVAWTEGFGHSGTLSHSARSSSLASAHGARRLSAYSSFVLVTASPSHC